MTTKSPILSKTLWFNVINAFVMVATQVTPDVLPFPVSPEFMKWQGFVLVVGNMLLRFLTTKPIMPQ